MIDATPAFFATIHPSYTSATAEFPERHFMESVLSYGKTAAVILKLYPSFKLSARWLNCMETAGTNTVTVQFAVIPFDAVTVITAEPAAFAFIRPL